jgi:hypothetical protein
MLKKILFSGGAIALVASGIYFANDASGSEVYDVPLKQAHQKLLSAKIPEIMGKPLVEAVRVSAPTDTSIKWDSPAFDGVYCVAQLETVNAKEIRALQKCYATDLGGLSTNDLIPAMEIALNEHIKSVLTGSTFDADKVGNAAIGYMNAEQQNITNEFERSQAAISKLIEEDAEDSTF